MSKALLTVVALVVATPGVGRSAADSSRMMTSDLNIPVTLAYDPQIRPVHVLEQELSPGDVQVGLPASPFSGAVSRPDPGQLDYISNLQVSRQRLVDGL